MNKSWSSENPDTNPNTSFLTLSVSFFTGFHVFTFSRTTGSPLTDSVLLMIDLLSWYYLLHTYHTILYYAY